MESLTPAFKTSVEAYRAHARHSEPLRCEALRLCGLAMASTMALESSRLWGRVDLGPIIRLEFVLTGYLIVDMLVRGRCGVESRTAKRAGDRASAFASFWRTFPASHLLGFILAILFLPPLLALESVPVPDLAELPAAVVRSLKSHLGEFLGTSYDGRTLMVWPLFLAFAPARLLGLGALTLVGGGLTVQVTILMGSQASPASVLVSPSPVDLLAAGALLGAILRGFGRSEDGPLARWALLMGMALAFALTASQFGDHRGGWGSQSLLSAPAGFGALNFILELIGTTLIGSLSWHEADPIGRTA